MDRQPESRKRRAFRCHCLCASIVSSGSPKTSEDDVECKAGSKIRGDIVGPLKGKDLPPAGTANSSPKPAHPAEGDSDTGRTQVQKIDLEPDEPTRQSEIGRFDEYHARMPSFAQTEPE